MNIDPRAISVRDLSIPDLSLILNYWFHSPPGYIEAIGVDPAKMPKEAEMEAGLKSKILENSKLPSSKLNALVITYDQRPIGFHTMNPLVQDDHGIFHAHLWEPDFRRKGVGLQSYPKACCVFMERFNLKKILFKTPIQNVGALRVKEKLGIRWIGEEIIDFGIIKAGTPAKVYELTREEAQKWR